jgi:hypothetical protein
MYLLVFEPNHNSEGSDAPQKSERRCNSGLRDSRQKVVIIDTCIVTMLFIVLTHKLRD